MSSGVCHTFQKSGSCKYGGQCKFSHSAEDQGSFGRNVDSSTNNNNGGSTSYGGSWGRSSSYNNQSRGQAICYQFQEKGQCKFGNQCRFSHASDENEKAISPNGGNSYGNRGGNSWSSFNSGRQPGPCYEFREFGNCKFGDRCKYSHGNASSTISDRTSGPCYQFKREGSCQYGEQCRFAHEITDQKDVQEVPVQST